MTLRTVLALLHYAERKDNSSASRLEGMDTAFLDQLAAHFRKGRSPACRRAIGRILTAIRERWERGEFSSESQAEKVFRDQVATQPACRTIDS